MTAETLLAEVRALGLELRPDGADLVVRPRGRLTAELREELRRHKPELLALLAPTWPPECLESVQRFGRPHARLFPLLGREVSTPYGHGRLVQAIADRAAVAMLAPDEDGGLSRRVIFVLPDEVLP